jgi:KamA family protein
MHCRYCFRQAFPYAAKTQYEEELALIAKDTSLHELILSGGDPLSLTDRDLKALLTSLDQMPHIQLIRFHTRFPIGIPERIDETFLSMLEECKTQIIFLIHTNHARELDADVLSALKKVQHCRIPILTQTVLLKGVNDSFEVLKELFLTCATAGIIPYYLHGLDQVEGTAHFEVDHETGRGLIHALRSHLPGYAVPRYVQEIPGKTEKTLLG